jgi:hypothetical protein
VFVEIKWVEPSEGLRNFMYLENCGYKGRYTYAQTHIHKSELGIS